MADHIPEIEFFAVGRGGVTGRYNYQVKIDGVHRATFEINVARSGYRLVTDDGEFVTAIPLPEFANARFHAVSADKKADFVSVIRANLHRIPTEEEVSDRIAGAARAKEMEREAQDAADEISAVKAFAADLRTTLEGICMSGGEDGNALDKGSRLLERIDAAVATAHTNREENRKLMGEV